MARMAVLVMRVLVTAFLAILFLQSGLDKVTDRAGNRAYLNGVFEKSPLRRFTGFLFVVITILEVLTGVLCAAGVLALVFFEADALAAIGALLAALVFISLFFGQRLAKDYAGAAGLVPYFLLSLVAIGLSGVS